MLGGDGSVSSATPPYESLRKPSDLLPFGSGYQPNLSEFPSTPTYTDLENYEDTANRKRKLPDPVEELNDEKLNHNIGNLMERARFDSTSITTDDSPKPQMKRKSKNKKQNKAELFTTEKMFEVVNNFQSKVVNQILISIANEKKQQAKRETREISQSSNTNEAVDQGNDIQKLIEDSNDPVLRMYLDKFQQIMCDAALRDRWAEITHSK